MVLSTPSEAWAATRRKPSRSQTHYRNRPSQGSSAVKLRKNLPPDSRVIGIGMTVADAIDTHLLRKVFGDYAAVKGLTLQVKQGEVFGFLGPNGAGKTTSMKMLLGLIAPTSGDASLLGKPIGNQEALRCLGFLPEHFRFQEWLSADEFL